MKLLIGLGNPGGTYARQRHNVGFMALDEIASRHSFSPWRKRFHAEVAEGALDGEKTLLIKPQTYMNESGRSVGEALRFYKLSPGDVFVFHDELDLAPGKLKVKTGGGAAGHNGLRSITQQIGADFHRVRIGIGHPGHKDKVSGFVLHDFSRSDQKWLEPMLDEMARAAGFLANDQAARFMTEVARHMQPPKPAGGKKKTDGASPTTDSTDKSPAERKLGKWDFAEKAARGGSLDEDSHGHASSPAKPAGSRAPLADGRKPEGALADKLKKWLGKSDPDDTSQD